MNAHMLADDSETDGVLSEHQLQVAAMFGKIMPDAALAAISELAHAEFLVALEGDRYEVADFRGLAHAEHELRRQETLQRQREAAAERQRRRRAKLAEEPDRDDHGDVTRDVTPRVRLHRREEIRQEELLGGRTPQDPPSNPTTPSSGWTDRDSAHARTRTAAMPRR